MPYIGNTIRAADDYRLIDDISSGFNGSTTSFALQVAGSAPVPFPKSPQQVLISVNGVIQEPDPTGASGFNLVGTNIVFSSAPTNGHAFFGIIYATADYLNAGGNFPAGSLGAPSITFIGDENTGLFRKGSGSVGFVSDATEIANFDSNGITISSGNLIIPGDIIHSGDTNTKIRFSDTDQIKLETGSVQKLRLDNTEVVVNDDGADVDFRVEGDTDTNLIRTDGGTDHVGIGTPAARAKFEVFDSSVSAAFSATDLSTWRVLQVRNNIESNTGTAAGIALGGDGSSDTETAGICGISGNNTGGVVDLAFLTATGNASTERMRILSGGNVGIGITNPTSTLHIDASGGAVLQLQRTASNASNRFTVSVDGTDATLDSSNALLFRNNGAERARITSAGRLGIGTTSPVSDIHTASSSDHIITHQSTTTGADIRMNFRDSGNTDKGGIHYLFNGNSLKFITAESERMRIDSAGRVGIGTTSLGSHQLISEGGKAETGGSCLALKTSGGANGITSDLALYGTFVTPTNDQATRRTADIVSGFATGNWGNEFLAFNVGKGGSSNDTQAVTDERMRITGAGNVGIGTSSPTGKLAVSDGTVVAEINPFSGSSGAFIGTRSNHAVLLKTNATERMRIESNGDVAIGTSSAGGNRLLVQLTDDNSDHFKVVGGSGQGRTNISVAAGNTSSTASTSYRLSDSSGNTVASLFFMNNADDLIIGTQKQGGEVRFHTSTASNSLGSIYRAKFDQNGIFHLGGASNNYGGKQRIFSQNDGTACISCVNQSTSGTVRQIDFFHGSNTSRIGSIQSNASATAYNTSSDYRLKENVVAISDGITRLKTLKPYRFNFKVDTSTKVDGFFAHEVTPAVPEAITGTKDEVDSDNNPVYQGIDQSKLVPLLTAALQEAIAKIETLETKVAALEAA